VPRLVQGWQGGIVEGVEAWTVADSAAILDEISRPDPLAWYNAPPAARPFASEVGGEQPPLRVGLVDTAPLGLPMDDACRDGVASAGRLLEALGHSVERVEFDTLPEELITMFLPIIWAGFVDYEGVDWTKVEPHNAAAYETASQTGLLDLARAIHGAERTSRSIVAHWGRDFDILLTPTLAIEPPPSGAVMEAAHAAGGEPAVPVLQMVAFTALANVTGLPAISLPLHRTGDGLPIGVQLTAGPWDESSLIRVASQLERAAPWADRRPDAEGLAAPA
jgi:amidase